MAMFLPIGSGKIVGDLRMSSQSADDNDGGSVTIGRVGHSTVISGLEAQVNAGDPVICVECLKNDPNSLNPTSECIIPTRASLMLTSLQEGTDILLPPDDPAAIAAMKWRRKPRSLLFSVIRFILVPLMALVLNWLLYLQSEVVLAYTPPFPFFGSSASQTIADVLPLHPADMLQAFDLGGLAARLAESSANEKELLAAAEKLMGRAVTAADLQGAREVLENLVNQKSLISSVYGFFTFVNIMWLLAILGIAVSLGPALWALTRPLRQIVLLLSTRIRDAIVWVLKEIVIPFCLRMHIWGGWELLGFLLAFMLTAQGCRMVSWGGMYVSISGLVASHMCCYYSFVLHGQRLIPHFRRHDHIECIIGLTSFLLASPLAIFFQSTLIAYGASIGFCFFIGTSWWLLPFFFLFGRNELMVTTGTSLVVMILYWGLRITGWAPAAVAPFSSPVSVFGGITLFTGVIIFSSYYYRDRERQLNYIVRNAVAVGAFALFITLGNVYHTDSLTNTAMTFSVLWLMCKYSEIHFEMRWNLWVLMLLASAVVYKGSLWLHANPAFVASLFFS